MTIDRVVSHFLLDCRLRGLSPRTVKFYDSRLRTFPAPWWGDHIERLEVHRIRERMIDLNVSVAT